jgi:PAS domain S-box-containing protein
MKPDSLKVSQPRRKWIPYFVLAIALLITALSTYYVATTTKAKDRLRFDNVVRDTHEDIQNRLDTYITLLRATSGLFAATGEVSRDEFRAFVNRLRLPQRYPGIQGIGFAERVMPQEKDALIAQMYKQGIKNFTIRPDFKRSEYYPIIYLEPLDRRNQKAIGFDMFTHRVRQTAMERARDTGAPAASGKVTLIQETDKHKQVGFLIYIPVYRNGGIPNTLAERRAELIGFAYSPFRAGDLMAGIFGNEEQQNVDFQIYDGKNLSSENLLHSSQGNISTSYQPRFTATRTIDVAGRTWTIAFASRPEFEVDSDIILAPYIALGGLVISLLLFGVTRTQTLARIAAERSADELRSSQEALRESEERYRAFIEHSSEGIWCFELEQPLSKELSEDQQIEHFYQYGYLVECNQVMAQMYGFSQPIELIGVRLGELLIQSEPLNIEYLRSFIRSGYKLNAAESYEVDKEGKPKYFLNNLVGIVENNVLLRAWGTQLDITQRKQAEEALRESNTRLQLALDAGQLGDWDLDLATKTAQRSLRHDRIFGYDSLLPQWSYEIFLSHVLPEDRKFVDQKFQRTLSAGEGWDFECRIVRCDRTIHWIWASGSIYRDANGKPIRMLGIVKDINERKQIEAELRLSEARFRMLLENVQDYAIFLLDANNRVVRWSAGAEKILGYHEAEILGQSGSIIFTPEDLQQGADKEELNTASSKGQAEDERWHIRKDGSRFWASGIMTPLRDSSGQLQGFAKIMRDFSDRKQAEQEREQLLKREQAARSEAEAANRMKDEFLATLSHELRTPLNAMLGWTQLLRTRKFNEATTTKALETIDRNTKSLAQLIEDVLDVSRIITGKLSLNIYLVELVPIIEAAIETVLPAAQAKNISLEFLSNPSLEDRRQETGDRSQKSGARSQNTEDGINDFPPLPFSPFPTLPRSHSPQIPQISSSPFLVLGDANRLQQVFWNLLSNAVKFTPKGGRVEVRLDVIDSLVHVQISDTGQGISPEFLPYIFDRFRQADATITREHGGLGLGLAIVRHLVELHGGNIYAKSLGVGQGATFIVELPIAAVSRLPTPEPQQREQGEMANKSALTPDLLLLNGLRVLVVDDELDARELIATVLGQCGAEVTTVASAGEALEAVEKLQPDVLVSDIGMPEEDGYTLIRKLMAVNDKLGKHIPAVALTAYAGAEARQKALSAGFQIHVSKPVDPSQLVAVVGNLAGRNYSLGGENTH